MKSSTRAPLVSASLVVALAACGCGDGHRRASSEEWSRFRGPNGLGVADTEPLPTAWGAESPNLRWTTKVPGFGESSPIVAGGRVYLTNAERDGDRLRHGVVAFDADSGEILWSTAVATRVELELRNRFGVHSGATPASDGERIYAYFGAELAALDLDGRILWTAVVEPDFEETTRYGAGSSPIVVGDSIILLQDKEYAAEEYDVGWLAAFDRHSGSLRWRTDFDEGCCSYVTPVVRETPAGAEILLALTQRVAAFSAATGELLWQDAQDMNQPVASPVLAGDLFCVASGAHNVRETVCRRLSGAGAETKFEPLWRTNRTVAETASPLLYEGNLYVLVQQGVITAYDSLTGGILWRERLARGAYHASLVAGDGKIYATNNAGITTVIGAGEAFTELAVNDLGERGSIATPALAGGRLYIRTSENLVCIEPEAAAPPAADH